jgi:universal stress protein A
MNVKKILCPMDFSEYSEAALVYASSLAKEFGSELHIVYVYERPFPYADAGFAGYVPPDDLEPDKQRLKEIVPPRTDVPVVRQFVLGHPADELVEYAEANGIDLIVMGTHGRTGLGRLLMGSVAESVVRRATCPVLTFKTPIEERVGDSDETTRVLNSPNS